MSKRLEEIMAKADPVRLQAEAHDAVAIAQLMLTFLPELSEEYDSWIEPPESDEFYIPVLPGMYNIVGLIVVPYLMVQLRRETNEGALYRIFAFLEQLASDPDSRIGDVVGIEFMEYMLGWLVDMTPVWPYIGEHTRTMYEEMRDARKRDRDRNFL